MTAEHRDLSASPLTETERETICMHERRKNTRMNTQNERIHGDYFCIYLYINLYREVALIIN
jgi:hypothetical protein